MQELAKEFVACADEVNHLQTVKGPEADLFRKVAEQGHYAGRVKPTSTRQGIYACAPNGVFLASINTTNAAAMAGMMEKALAKWKELKPEDRLMKEAPGADPGGRTRWERLFPADGLVLKDWSRDLPREGPARAAWNLDFAWFRKEEARRFLPDTIEEGALHEVPREIVLRLARFHFVDNVRGQTYPWQEAEIATAELAAIVDEVNGGRARIRFAGKTKATAVGKWRVNGFDPTTVDQKRGFDAKILGSATWDLAKERFVEFELIAAGTRWGGTQYNGRPDDLGEAPMAHLLRLAGDTPAERVAPASIWGYGWK
ncbi:MAG: hypothetical protein FD180_335 [Planctomycetota bacterium]|nr:MAG: hypothetical protein FD180_335 [Planctomycetota bacterium]